VPILLGSDEVEWRQESGRRVPDRFYNSAFLVAPDGRSAGVYRKIQLVPFGEYVPFRKLLFFAAPLVEAVGAGFVGGTDATLLPVAGHSISVAICYEIVYPNLVRQFVKGGSQLLTTITNDAWFGATSAPYQHFMQAAVRAIENGRYLVRAANTGISGAVDPYGRVLAQTDIFEPAVVVGQVRTRLTGRLVDRELRGPGEHRTHAAQREAPCTVGAQLGPRGHSFMVPDQPDWSTSSARRRRTRSSIASRMIRTSSIGRPAGSSRGQSSYRVPGK